MFSSLLTEAKESCSGKSWTWRLMILIWFGMIFLRHLSDADYGSLLAPLNLGIHEFGHLIFGWAPQFIGIAGGTLTQLAAPIFGLWNFYQQDDFFAMTLCFGWLSVNLFDVARYQSDARTMALDLVSPFGNEGVIHDWNYMLSHTGLLNFDGVIAGFTRLLAVAAMLVCLTAGGWIIVQMILNRPAQPS